MVRYLTLVFLLSLFAIEAESQKFQFGLNTSLNISQVEGDKLRGFNKFGFSGGLVGGYALNDNNWIVSQLKIDQIGSKRKSEKLNAFSDNILVELNINTANILLGFEHKFGDNWDGKRNFHFMTGLSYHRVISENIQEIRDAFVGPEVKSVDVKSNLFTMQVGVGRFITDELTFDIHYTHSFTNLLKEPVNNIGKLVPFYLNLGVSYYLAK